MNRYLATLPENLKHKPVINKNNKSSWCQWSV